MFKNYGVYLFISLSLTSCGGGSSNSDSTTTPNNTKSKEIVPAKTNSTEVNFEDYISITNNPAPYNENMALVNIFKSTNINFGLRKTKNDESDQFIISPFQINQQKLIAALGAKNATLDAFINDIFIDRTTLTYANLNELLNYNFNKSSYLSKTAFWGQCKYLFSSFYLNTIDAIFHPEFLPTEFGYATSLCQPITDTTNWFALLNSGTNIEKYLIPEKIFRTRLIQADVLQISKNWGTQSNNTVLTESRFQYFDEWERHQQKKIPALEISGNINYYNNNQYETYELPIDGTDTKLLVYMPYKNTFSTDVEQLNEQFVTDIRTNLTEKNITIYFPVLNIENYFNNLAPDLAYSKTNADFSGINNRGFLYIDSMENYTSFTADETGINAVTASLTKYSATFDEPQYPNSGFPASSVITSATSRPNLKGCFDKEQIRPFVFFIIDTSNDIVLFMGKVKDIDAPKIEPAYWVTYADGVC